MKSLKFFDPRRCISAWMNAMHSAGTRTAFAVLGHL
jgi:hypothetical protein